MKRKTAHANVAQAVQFRVIWAMMEDLSKGNDTPFTGVAGLGGKAALAERSPMLGTAPAQGVRSARTGCGQRSRAACPADVRA
ncbi:hypothetical protein EHI47_21135 [Rhizobium leguminosarum]|uniref:Uncharacterized protein n=2 Tax=Rhizobium TaxID=379 RepID=A0A444HVC0_RHILE|nr:hypothetical protein [Rhizobium leguminosarum bv. viciae]RWX27500.1 hypothetical protein EHI47_21135 [Rhizobium leguminosarum]TBE72043.1 hypothetical protein ELH03_15380 [Rhizobium beringeri]TAU54157.1 hypothetical protein ELI43_15720 [Rhizobium leguminosarum]TBC74189.1 hypothetical protein ELH27_15575 [Rhizobium leguminosarum]